MIGHHVACRLDGVRKDPVDQNILHLTVRWFSNLRRKRESCLSLVARHRRGREEGREKGRKGGTDPPIGQKEGRHAPPPSMHTAHSRSRRRAGRGVRVSAGLPRPLTILAGTKQQRGWALRRRIEPYGIAQTCVSTCMLLYRSCFYLFFSFFKNTRIIPSDTPSCPWGTGAGRTA
jgi:hypothetical protein